MRSPEASKVLTPTSQPEQDQSTGDHRAPSFPFRSRGHQESLSPCLSARSLKLSYEPSTPSPSQQRGFRQETASSTSILDQIIRTYPTHRSLVTHPGGQTLLTKLRMITPSVSLPQGSRKFRALSSFRILQTD